MHYLETIKQKIEKTLKQSFGLENVNFTVGFPEDLKHGDVTTNVCLVASKLAGKSPREVGEILLSGLEKLKDSSLSFVEKYEQVGPGFINIWLKKEIVQREVESKILDEVKVPSDEGKFVSKKYYGKRVLVEHSSPNLFKTFTVGHLMNNFTGEFVARILKEVGADVTTMSYPSDVSLGIGKAMYIFSQKGGHMNNEYAMKSLEDKVKFLGECYVEGVKFFEENPDKVDLAKNETKKIYNFEEDLNYKEARKTSVEYFLKMLKNLGSEFNEMVFESQAAARGQLIINELFKLGKIFEFSEGAIVYKPSEERKDINTTVFINSEGHPTYAGKDIGLLEMKFKERDNGFRPDESFFITDNEQIPHFKVVLDAAESMRGEFKGYAEHSHHISHGRMTLKGNKMSSRLGGVPSGEEVINAVLEEVKEKAGNEEAGKNRFEGMSAEEVEALQKEIALSALRVAILRSKPGVNIDFDPDRSLSFEGDSGPYLCYTHARCCSLLEKSVMNLSKIRTEVSPPLSGEDLGGGLERKIFQFEKIVVDAAEEIAPQKLIKYLFEVAGEFNNFYAHNKIIDENDLEKTRYNLYLTKLVQTVLKKGLYLIGVDAPQKM